MFQSLTQRPLLIFFICMLLIAAPLFLFPINLFNGEVVMVSGKQTIIEQAHLSLSYFIGIGYTSKDMADIKEFYLLPDGYAFAACLIIGFPIIIAYRFRILNKQKEL